MKRLVCLLIFLSSLTYADDIKNLANSLCKMLPKEAVFTEGIVYEFTSGGPKKVKVYVKRGNMSAQGAEVVVDAANKDIDPGGGVSGYLFQWAGKLTGVTKNEWKSGRPQNFKAGDAWLNTHPKVRIAYNHNTKKESDFADTGCEINQMQIIHAVGPQCGNLSKAMTPQHKNDLANAYENSLKIADKAKLSSIVFPFLSADIFGCKNDDASKAAIKGVFDYLVTNKDTTALDEVHFVLLQDDVNEEKKKYQLFLYAVVDWNTKNENVKLKKTALTPNQ